MSDFTSKLPRTDSLKRGLTKAFLDEGLNGHSLTLLGREPTAYSTTFPCEIVTCRIGRGKPRRLFCKYTADVDYTGHGHRGGVKYETAVYRDILGSTQHVRPKFYGGYMDPDTGQNWLFLEYLDGSLRLGKLDDAAVMARTARWIAQFHVNSKQLLVDKRFRFLKRYDQDYYLGWVRRTYDFATSAYRRALWFRRLRKRAEEFLAPLLSMQPTIIHGEYYQHNILFHQGQVCTVDWESAAVAEGVIDLASLTEGWGPEIMEACSQAYIRTRWPEGAPAKFDKLLRAARLYMTFRWLGDDRETTRSWNGKGHWRQLHSLAAELERE